MNASWVIKILIVAITTRFRVITLAINRVNFLVSSFDAVVPSALSPLLTKAGLNTDLGLTSGESERIAIMQPPVQELAGA